VQVEGGALGHYPLRPHVDADRYLFDNAGGEGRLTESLAGVSGGARQGTKVTQIDVAARQAGVP
jgi:hypothetical protein